MAMLGHPDDNVALGTDDDGDDDDDDEDDDDDGGGGAEATMTLSVADRNLGTQQDKNIIHEIAVLAV